MPVDIGENPKPTVIVRMGEGINIADMFFSFVKFGIHGINLLMQAP